MNMIEFDATWDRYAWANSRYINGAVIRSLIAYLEQRFGPDEARLADLELDAEFFKDHEHYPGRLYLYLLELGSEISQNPMFGFEYGQQADTDRWGIMGYVLSVSDTLEEVLQCQSRYQALVGNIGCTMLHTEGNQCLMEWYTDGDPGRFAAEEALAGWVRFARRLLSPDARPVQVFFRHSEPSNAEAYHRFFGCPVHFDSPLNAIEVPQVLLALPIPKSDEAAHERLNLYAQQLLEETGGDNSMQQMKAHIIRTLPKSVPTIESVAKKFGLTSRKLQRKFDQHGIPFKQFLDHTRRDLALNYLANGNHNLLELTFMLGFSEQSALQRAFKRWTGATPKAYLKSLEKSLQAE